MGKDFKIQSSHNHIWQVTGTEKKESLKHRLRTILVTKNSGRYLTIVQIWCKPWCSRFYCSFSFLCVNRWGLALDTLKAQWTAQCRCLKSQFFIIQMIILIHFTNLTKNIFVYIKKKTTTITNQYDWSTSYRLFLLYFVWQIQARELRECSVKIMNVLRDCFSTSEAVSRRWNSRLFPQPAKSENKNQVLALSKYYRKLKK